MTSLAAFFFAALPFFPFLSVSYLPFGGDGGSFILPTARIFALVIFIFWLFRGLFKKNLFISTDFIGITICAFLFFAGISGFWAIDKEAWLRKFLLLLNVFLLYFPFCQILREKIAEDAAFLTDRITGMLKTIFFSGAVISIVGILQFLGQFIIAKEDLLQWFFNIFGPIFYGGNLQAVVLEYPSFFVSIGGNDYLRAFGFFPSPQNFALFVGIIFFFSFIIKDNIPKPLFYGGITAMIFAILFTLSRGAYITLITTAFISIICYILTTKHETRKKVFSMSYIVFSVLVVLLLLFSPFMRRLTDIFSLSDTSRLGRIELWQKSFILFKENPIIGVGLGGLPIYIEPDKDFRAPVNAHNTYLEVAAELGLVGLIIFALIFLSFLYRIMNYARLARRESKRELRITLASLDASRSGNYELRITDYGLGGLKNCPFILYPIFYFLIFSVFETTLYFFLAMALLMLIFGISQTPLVIKNRTQTAFVISK